MSNTPHELWCLVEEENPPFPVLAPPTPSIGEFKAMIRKNIGTDLPAYRLILWKVCYFYPFVLLLWATPL